MAEFKEGDVVRLKSGSPDMTIHQYPYQEFGASYDDRAYCKWFDGSEVKGDVFKLSGLEKD